LAAGLGGRIRRPDLIDRFADTRALRPAEFCDQLFKQLVGFALRDLDEPNCLC